MEHCVILNNVNSLIQEINLIQQMTSTTDAKSLNNTLANAIANWLRSHPNSKVTELLANVATLTTS